MRHTLKLGKQIASLVRGNVVEEDHKLVLHASGIFQVGLHESSQW